MSESYQILRIQFNVFTQLDTWLHDYESNVYLNVLVILSFAVRVSSIYDIDNKHVILSEVELISVRLTFNSLFYFNA